MKYKILFIALIIFFFSACKKESNGTQLPAITHSGHDVLGYKINGKVVSGYNSFLSLITFYYYQSSGIVDIYASNRNPDCTLGFTFQYHDSLGNYPLSWIYPYNANFLDNTNGKISGTHCSANYSIDSIYNGTVTIAFFDGNNISGYFQFDAISDSGVVVHITDGIFDLYEN